MLSFHSVGWTKVTEVPAPETSSTITHLRENMDYQFRIIAMNKAGPSEPSDPSRLITCKSRYGMQTK